MYIIHYYKVSGPGSFPIDMLRYDGSFPRHERDAGMIEQTFDSDGTPGPVIELQRITSSRDWSPTSMRWKSFGWQVVQEGD